MKQMGARSAGNPHAACDVEGAGNVERSRCLGLTGAPVLDPTKVLGLGSTDPLSGDVSTSAGYVIVAYFGGRSIEKVARIFKR
jgi:hypothetical protein